MYITICSRAGLHQIEQRPSLLGSTIAWLPINKDFRVLLTQYSHLDEYKNGWQDPLTQRGRIYYLERILTKSGPTIWGHIFTFVNWMWKDDRKSEVAELCYKSGGVWKMKAWNMFALVVLQNAKGPSRIAKNTNLTFGSQCIHCRAWVLEIINRNES